MDAEADDRRRSLHLVPMLLVSLALAASRAEDLDASRPPPLDQVKGMERLSGSAEARALLASNGFVVADPFYRQIFEPYVENPLPVFITTDSAWHTYHVLIEEGVRQLEEAQARRLREFSRQLAELTKTRMAAGEPEWAELHRFVQVGLAFQDSKHLASLPPPDRRIVEALRAGDARIEVPIGFPLLAAQFRPVSFYSVSEQLADYFAARQWYGSVVFRLDNPWETRLALLLSGAVRENPDLERAWQTLSRPYDELLGRAEDGQLDLYATAVQGVLGEPVNAARVKQHLVELQRELASIVPMPRVNDQGLDPEEYRRFGTITRGFRLFPPRRLPCAVCFQDAVEPVIPHRWFPSGLDFFVASPVMRSPAAVRALESLAGKQVAAAVQSIACGPMRDSLQGEAMQLLSGLQMPVPAAAPAALRTDAWADKQLWTQLGAWAGQRHTWALHTKITVAFLGMADGPAGFVSPYPEFFEGLARLSRRTARALGQAGLEPESEARAAVPELLEEFAQVCERLARLAREHLAGQPLVETDADWIRTYGPILARFHLYEGNSFLAPRDDFPFVTRVFSSPVRGASLYAGLARPQTLYLLAPHEGGWWLHCGAVMSYREFVQPDSLPLTDESWRQMVSSGQTPPAPPFTRSFYAETGLEALLERLRATDPSQPEQRDSSLLELIQARARAADLTNLVAVMIEASRRDDLEAVRGLAQTIAGLPWEPHQPALLQLLAHSDQSLADAAARVLTNRPASIDWRRLVSGCNQAPIRERRFRCVLLSCLPEPDEAVQETLRSALGDQAAGVRWQAALAVGTGRCKDEGHVHALLGLVGETNRWVGAAAVHALVALRATNTAPQLLARLQELPISELLPPDDGAAECERRRELAAMFHTTPDELYPVLDSPLDVGRLFWRKLPARQIVDEAIGPAAG